MCSGLKKNHFFFFLKKQTIFYSGDNILSLAGGEPMLHTYRQSSQRGAKLKVGTMVIT